MKKKMTAKEKREADWQFKGTMRNCGSSIEWVIQVDRKTMRRRYIRSTSSTHGDSSNGKTIIRYTTPRN